MKRTTREISKSGKKHSPSLIKRYRKHPAKAALKHLSAKEAARDWGSLPTANTRYMSVLQPFFCVCPAHVLWRRTWIYIPPSKGKKIKNIKRSCWTSRPFFARKTPTPLQCTQCPWWEGRASGPQDQGYQWDWRKSQPRLQPMVTPAVTHSMATSLSLLLLISITDKNCSKSIL